MVKNPFLEKTPDVLDCTLRDGSYVIDYRFTLEDALMIAVCLQQAGVRWIEIGHGLGIGAYALDKTKDLLPDKAYLEMLSPMVKESRLGVFCIPGIATLKDLKRVARSGASFVRIGADIDSTKKMESFVKEAKFLGLVAAANFMKSYAYDKHYFLAQCEKVAAWGADCAYLVDSAGGMFPEEVSSYIKHAKQRCGIPIGFHGHNNLNLGAANCLAAVEAGAVIMDATLQGMGRSAGNVQIESLVAILQKKGVLSHIDLFKILDVGQNIVRPFMQNKSGITKNGTVLGYSRFHSSFLPIVSRVAESVRETRLARLLVEIGKENQVSVTDETVRTAIRALRKGRVSSSTFEEKDLRVLEKGLGAFSRMPSLKGWKAMTHVLQRMESLKCKSGKLTVLAVSGAFSANVKQTRFPFLRESAGYVIGNAEPCSADDAAHIFKLVDGRVDYVAIDRDHEGSRTLDLERLAKKFLKRTKWFRYRDLHAWSSGIVQLVRQFPGKRVKLIGDEEFLFYLKQSFEAWQFKTEVCDLNEKISEDCTLVLASRRPLRHLPAVGPQVCVLDATALSLTEKQIRQFRKSKASVVRFDGRLGVMFEIESLVATLHFHEKVMGSHLLDGFKLVAGGVMGEKGDIVVDSISNPVRILGVADGKGGLLNVNRSGRFGGRVQTTLKFLASKRLNESWFSNDG